MCVTFANVFLRAVLGALSHDNVFEHIFQLFSDFPTNWYFWLRIFVKWWKYVHKHVLSARKVTKFFSQTSNDAVHVLLQNIKKMLYGPPRVISRQKLKIQAISHINQMFVTCTEDFEIRHCFHWKCHVKIPLITKECVQTTFFIPRTSHCNHMSQMAIWMKYKNKNVSSDVKKSNFYL